MTANLKGKKILFLAPRFYGYYDLIRKEMEKAGAEVTYTESFIFLEDRRHNHSVVDRLYRSIRNPRYRSKHTRNILREIGDAKFDFLFAVSVYSPSPELIDVLRQRNPSLKTCIYFWDAFSTWDFAYQMKYFDFRFSFDLNDCIEHTQDGLIHLPLFYTEPEQAPPAPEYDLTHIGSLHPKYKKRAHVIAQMYNQAQNLGLNVCFYLVHLHENIGVLHFPLKYIFKYAFNPEYRRFVQEIARLYPTGDFIHTRPLSLDQVREIESKSKCIVDINIDRSGVAMRIIGALASGKKVITNNKYIVNERFYHPDNICILDERNPVVDIDFLNSPRSNVDMSNLRLDNWLTTIFNQMK